MLEQHEFKDSQVIDGRIILKDGKLCAELEIQSDKLLDNTYIILTPNDLVTMINEAKKENARLKERQ